MVKGSSEAEILEARSTYPLYAGLYTWIDRGESEGTRAGPSAGSQASSMAKQVGRHL